jgi:hypothetical protein
VHNPAAFENAFRCRTVTATAAPLFVEYAKRLADQPLAVISPDTGGRRGAFSGSVETAREPIGKKPPKHRSSGVVSGDLFVGEVAGATALVMKSHQHRHTLVRAAGARQASASRVLAMVTHGLFMPGGKAIAVGADDWWSPTPFRLPPRFPRRGRSCAGAPLRRDHSPAARRAPSSTSSSSGSHEPRRISDKTQIGAPARPFSGVRTFFQPMRDSQPPPPSRDDTIEGEQFGRRWGAGQAAAGGLTTRAQPLAFQHEEGGSSNGSLARENVNRAIDDAAPCKPDMFTAMRVDDMAAGRTRRRALPAREEPCWTLSMKQTSHLIARGSNSRGGCREARASRRDAPLRHPHARGVLIEPRQQRRSQSMRS